jgi:hypothetical protein
MFSAKAVLQQLGGNKFAVMTGASGFVAGPNFLQFCLPKKPGYCKNGINKVKITLEPSDTYTVEFYRIRGVDFTLISKHEDVYNDMLQELFTRETGLATNLYNDA